MINIIIRGDKMNNAFNLESNSIWSFKDRGNLNGHKGDYRGNWTPFVPRNIILRYSKEDDLVLDQFLGSGTTLMESKLLNRRGVGIDINMAAINIAMERIKNIKGNTFMYIKKGDARNLDFIKNESIDLICTHPPYSNIIKYSKDINEDLSLMSINNYYENINKVAEEAFRVLKKDKYCTIMIGDIRKNGFVIPLGFNVMNIFLKNNFRLKEIIIKEQHNCKSTEKWREISKKNNFLLIQHEYIFVLKKELF